MDVETLKELQMKQTLQFIFFWSHTPKYANRIGKSCLSQWYEAPFEADGKHYLTSEHYMMAAKARLFGDSEVEQAILREKHPNNVKKLGRTVKNFDQQIWDENKMAIVEEANYLKFATHIELKEYLIGTDRHILVEANPMDNIWGIGLPYNHPGAMDVRSWRGKNLLGFAIMAVRDKLRQEQIN